MPNVLTMARKALHEQFDDHKSSVGNTVWWVRLTLVMCTLLQILGSSGIAQEYYHFCTSAWCVETYFSSGSSQGETKWGQTFPSRWWLRKLKQKEVEVISPWHRVQVEYGAVMPEAREQIPSCSHCLRHKWAQNLALIKKQNKVKTSVKMENEWLLWVVWVAPMGAREKKEAWSMWKPGILEDASFTFKRTHLSLWEIIFINLEVVFLVKFDLNLVYSSLMALEKGLWGMEKWSIYDLLVKGCLPDPPPG